MPKNVSDIDKAILMLKTDNDGSLSLVFTGDPVERRVNFKNKIIKYLVNATDCYNETSDQACGYSVTPDTLPRYKDGAIQDNILKDYNDSMIRLPDGAIIAVDGAGGADCPNEWWTKLNWCGYLYIDTNGPKGPNFVGKDWFIFPLYADGIYKGGAPNWGATACADKCLTHGLSYTCGCWRMYYK